MYLDLKFTCWCYVPYEKKTTLEIGSQKYAELKWNKTFCENDEKVDGFF